MQIEIKNVKIIDQQSKFNGEIVDLSIENGIISGIKKAKKGTGKALAVISVGGVELWKATANSEELCVSNGWVDVFADYCEPGYEHKETISSGLKTAAAGGFTDVLLAPNTQPVISSKSIIQYILGQAANGAVTLHPIGAATQNTEGKELAEMMDMKANGAVAFSDGWKPVQNANLILKALEYVKAFGGTLIQLPVDSSLASGGLMNEGIVSTGLGLSGIPLLAETLMVYRDLELVKYTGSRLHITGLSSAEAVDMIRKAKADGVAVSCSVTPYHLSLTEDTLTSYDSNYKVSPPLRSETDRMALIDGLLDGTIDCIATHHRPQDWDAKVKEFEYAANGIALQEVAFSVLWDSLNEYMGIDKLVPLLCNNPRQIFGLSQQPVAIKSRASLTIFTTTGKTTITKDNKKSSGVNNPFMGKTLSGSVVGICSNGKIELA